MAEIKISPEAQKILIELQTFQQQMQTVLIQKEGLNMQNMEIDKALEELNKTKHDDVYKAVGPILIKSTKNELSKELSEKKETIELRLKSLQKQENRVKERLKESQEKFEEILKKQEGSKTTAG
ncbi:MAG: prefoldin subunit beta [Candidatus Aenigmarchaeota archaeon]|nr:prefoldin subunit beta [Candidatus Aenigmarchaeota archaeon]